MNTRNVENELKATTRYLRIQSSGLIVCNSKLREFLDSIFEVENVIFKKIGPLRKYCQEGVMKLRKPVDSDMKGLYTEYRGKEIELSPISSESALYFERDNQRKIYFGGASPWTTVESITEYLSSFGPISYAKLMDKPASNGTKFGFIIYEERWSVDRLMQPRKPIVIDGYKLFVCEYTNRGQNRSRKSKSKIDPSNKNHSETLECNSNQVSQAKKHSSKLEDPGTYLDNTINIQASNHTDNQVTNENQTHNDVNESTEQNLHVGFGLYQSQDKVSNQNLKRLITSHSNELQHSTNNLRFNFTVATPSTRPSPLLTQEADRQMNLYNILDKIAPVPLNFSMKKRK